MVARIGGRFSRIGRGPRGGRASSRMRRIARDALGTEWPGDSSSLGVGCAKVGGVKLSLSFAHKLAAAPEFPNRSGRNRKPAQNAGGPFGGECSRGAFACPALGGVGQ